MAMLLFQAQTDWKTSLTYLFSCYPCARQVIFSLLTHPNPFDALRGIPTYIPFSLTKVIYLLQGFPSQCGFRDFPTGQRRCGQATSFIRVLHESEASVIMVFTQIFMYTCA